MRTVIDLDYSLIQDVEMSNIHKWDAPDFTDAYVDKASYEGRAMTDDELEVLNEDRDFVYEKTIAWLY